MTETMEQPKSNTVELSCGDETIHIPRNFDAARQQVSRAHDLLNEAVLLLRGAIAVPIPPPYRNAFDPEDIIRILPGVVIAAHATRR